MATILEVKSKLLQALQDCLRVAGVETQKYFQERIQKTKRYKTGNDFTKRTYETRLQKGKKSLQIAITSMIALKF